MLPFIAESLGLKTSVKEGWLSGLAGRFIRDNSGICLGICFPFAPSDNNGNHSANHRTFSEDCNGSSNRCSPSPHAGHESISGNDSTLNNETALPDGITLRGRSSGIAYYGFDEDTSHPERYDSSLEQSLGAIIADFKPDIVHCFGTEYPHTLAMARAFGRPERLLIGIQGLMYVYSDAYRAGLPDYVWNRSTFRDVIRKDPLRTQHQKFIRRGEYEKEALFLTGNITGRTSWDKKYTEDINPGAVYHFMNETLRDCFYDKTWDEANATPHSIFVSQANYPIKGFHYLLQAMPEVLEKYPDTTIYAAGDNVTRRETLKDKLKLSSYGKYLLELIGRYDLHRAVSFTGPLDRDGMLRMYLKCEVFVSPSAIENSPNSVGEAMLLGMNVITSDGGGVTSMISHNVEGQVFPVGDTAALARQIIRVFDRDPALADYRSAAKERARRTHDPDTNFRRLLEIYSSIYS